MIFVRNNEICFLSGSSTWMEREIAEGQLLVSVNKIITFTSSGARCSQP